MKTAVALLAFVACASAGLAPAVYHAHHHPAYLAAPVPVVKHIAPAVYAVPQPLIVKQAVYAPAPVVKVLAAPAPVVKTVHHHPVAFGPLGYGAYGLHHHHDLHHHHHGLYL